jgi:hypothetical protein
MFDWVPGGFTSRRNCTAKRTAGEGKIAINVTTGNRG